MATNIITYLCLLKSREGHWLQCVRETLDGMTEWLEYYKQNTHSPVKYECLQVYQIVFQPASGASSSSFYTSHTFENRASVEYNKPKPKIRNSLVGGGGGITITDHVEPALSSNQLDFLSGAFNTMVNSSQ